MRVSARANSSHAPLYGISPAFAWSIHPSLSSLFTTVVSCSSTAFIRVVTLVALLSCLFADHGYTQNERRMRRSPQFFSAKALARSNEIASDRSFEPITSGLWLGALGDELEIEPVREIGMSNQRRSGAFQFYRTAYQQASLSAMWSRLDEDRTTEQFAEKVFLFEGATALSRAIMHSPLGLEIRRVSESLTKVKNAVTLKVSRAPDGGFVTASGASNRERSPLELSFSTTPNRIIEPRLRMGEHLLLRWDALGGQTLLEVNWNF